MKGGRTGLRMEAATNQRSPRAYLESVVRRHSGGLGTVENIALLTILKDTRPYNPYSHVIPPNPYRAFSSVSFLFNLCCQSSTDQLDRARGQIYSKAQRDQSKRHIRCKEHNPLRRSKSERRCRDRSIRGCNEERNAWEDSGGAGRSIGDEEGICSLPI